MAALEIKLSAPGKSHCLLKRDVEAIVCLYGGTMRDLAKRIPCSFENLSRVLNGRVEYPILRAKINVEIARMIAELKMRRRVGQLIKVA